MDPAESSFLLSQTNPTQLVTKSGYNPHSAAPILQGIPLEHLQRLLDLGYDLVFTGHSMGGAVASLLMLRLLESHGPDSKYRHQLQCFTFGMPMFANPQLAEYLNTAYQGHFYHFVSRNDPVPR